jgi:putative ABC transport system ATP-binding protein
MAYVGPDTFLRNGSVRESLLYPLSHHPSEEGRRIGDPERLHEALASGNPTYDVDTDWVDYASAGVTDRASLDRRIIEMLRLTELNSDVFELGLKTRLEANANAELTGRILEARRELRARLGRPPLSALVEPFDPALYCKQLTVAENLLFGTTLTNDLGAERLPRHPYLLQLLGRNGLDAELFEIGRKIATTISEVFAGLPSGHRFFEQIAIMKSDELPTYQAALKRLSGRAWRDAGEEDRTLMLRLAFAYQEPVLRMGLLTDDLCQRLVGARNEIHSSLPAALQGAIAFYRPEVYNTGATLEDNILFGRIVQGVADGPERVREAIREVLEELELTRAVKDAGLLYNVGPGGKRLSLAQRQKLGLARALVKRPDVLVVNRGLSALSPRNQRALAERILEAAQGGRDHAPFTIVWVTGDAELAKDFDRAIVVKGGRIVADGEPQKALARSTSGPAG